MSDVASYEHGQVSVSTAAAQIATGQTNTTGNISLYAHSGNSSTLYLGSSSAVTSTTGYALEAGKSLQVGLENIDELWVIAAGGTPKVSWLSAQFDIS